MRKNKRKFDSFVVIAFVAFLGGCSVHLVNETPISYTDNPQMTYPIQVAVTKELLVVPSSINVKAIIDGTEHGMIGSGAGVWTQNVRANCKHWFEVKYNAVWQSLPFLLSSSTSVPEQGVFHVEIHHSAGPIRIWTSPHDNGPWVGSYKFVLYTAPVLNFQNFNFEPFCASEACQDMVQAFSLELPVPKGAVCNRGTFFTIKSTKREARAFLNVQTDDPNYPYLKFLIEAIEIPM